jgi:hypothetical protein
VRGLLAGVGLVVIGSVMATDAVARQDGQEQARHAPTSQAPAGHAPTGRIIEAQDGDTVVVDHKARVRIVKRTPGRVRIAVNQERGFVVVMLDKDSDGRADWAYRFKSDQPYPLEAPWEGAAAVDEYFEPNRPGGGIGVVTPQGVIQFLAANPRFDNPHEVPNALAVVRTHGTTGGLVSDSFAVVEPYWLEGRESEYRGSNGVGNFRFGVSMTASPTPPAPENGRKPPPDPKP